MFYGNYGEGGDEFLKYNFGYRTAKTFGNLFCVHLNCSHARVVRYLLLIVDDVELGARVRIRGENRQPHAVHDVRGDGGGDQQARFQSAIDGRTVAHVEHGRKDIAPVRSNGPGEIAAVARHTIVLREEGHYTLGVSTDFTESFFVNG